MTTWQWNDGVSGAWFAPNWIADGASTLGGPPVSGDTAILLDGTAVVSGGAPAVDGVTLLMGSTVSGTPGVLRATNGVFGSGFAVEDIFNTGSAEFLSIGTTSFAGTLEAERTGVAFIVQIGTDNGSGLLSNSGTFGASNGGILEIVAAAGASLANAGNILVSAGATVSILSAVTGTGHFVDQGVLTLTGSVAGGETVDMSSGSAVLKLGTVGSFAATITGFSGGDVIDLVGTAADKTVYSNGTLTITNGGDAVATLTLANGSTLNAFSDGAGGTILSLEQLGTPDQVASFMTGLNSDGTTLSSVNFWAWNGNAENPAYSVNNGRANDWGAGGTISFSFDPSSNWTAAEENVFFQAITLWSAVANVHFVNTSNGALTITRGGLNTGAFGGNTYSFGGGENAIGHDISGTISIDTTENGFALNNSGSAVFSYVGGYDLLTALHELGHVLGLGHPGPYNDGNGTPVPIDYTDTRQYSVMSYFDAQAPADDTIGGTTYVSTTPGLYDIYSIQRLYGTSTATTLGGGQIFGFNTNTGIASYDFTLNTNPVVTLFDTGLNNTLDLSGFSSASTVDLRPGTFSSTDGMIDDLSIYYATQIDGFVGSAGGNIVTVNGDNDRIIGGGSNNTVIFPNAFGSYSFSRAGDVLSVVGGGLTDLLTGIQTLQFSDQSVAANTVACFASGTRILTLAGEIAVEDLRVGDMLPLLHPIGRGAVTWIGHRRVDCRRHKTPEAVWPIRVQADAFGPGVPHCALRLSPDHAVYVDGVLIPIRYLVNGASIAQERVDTITYWHVELPDHGVLLAEGLAAESYLDTGNRGAFANGGGAVQAHPDFARGVWAARSCAKLVLEGVEMVAVRQKLLCRALQLGHAMEAASDLHLLAGGAVVRPCAVEGSVYRFALPEGVTDIRILSHSGIPAELDPASRDARRLGVMIGRIVLHAEGRARVIALAGRTIGAGFHRLEIDGGRRWRWTDGDARLSLSNGPGPRQLALHVDDVQATWRAERHEGGDIASAGPFGRSNQLQNSLD